MSILVSCPEIDNITRYLRIWTKDLIKRHELKHDFLLLEKGKATKKRFCGMLKKLTPDVVLINGHGNYNRVCGHNNEVLLDERNVYLLDGKMVHALSCRSARVLGKIAVENRAKGYVGYMENWTLIMRRGMLSNPLHDTTAELFMRPAFKVQEALIDGRKASEAVEIGREEYKKSIKKAFRGSVQSDWEQCAPYLFANMKYLKAWEAEN